MLPCFHTDVSAALISAAMIYGAMISATMTSTAFASAPASAPAPSPASAFAPALASASAPDALHTFSFDTSQSNTALLDVVKMMSFNSRMGIDEAL